MDRAASPVRIADDELDASGASDRAASRQDTTDSAIAAEHEAASSQTTDTQHASGSPSQPLLDVPLSTSESLPVVSVSADTEVLVPGSSANPEMQTDRFDWFEDASNPIDLDELTHEVDEARNVQNSKAQPDTGRSSGTKDSFVPPEASTEPITENLRENTEPSAQSSPASAPMNTDTPSMPYPAQWPSFMPPYSQFGMPMPMMNPYAAPNCMPWSMPMSPPNMAQQSPPVMHMPPSQIQSVLCQSFARGACTFPQCRLRHCLTEAELAVVVNSRDVTSSGNKPLCQSWARQSCSNMSCPFRHFITEQELFTISTFGMSQQQPAWYPAAPTLPSLSQPVSPMSQQTPPLQYNPQPVSTDRKPCVFFQKGICRNGAQCLFSHDVAVLHPSTPASPVVCRFWKDRKCNNGDVCPFAHPLDQQPEPPSKSGPAREYAGSQGWNASKGRSERMSCIFFKQGDCHKGNACPHPHDQDEQTPAAGQSNGNSQDDWTSAGVKSDINSWLSPPGDPWGTADAAAAASSRDTPKRPASPDGSKASSHGGSGFSQGNSKATSWSTGSNNRSDRSGYGGPGRHGREDRRFPRRDDANQQVCKWFNDGTCRAGSTCRFKHELPDHVDSQGNPLSKDTHTTDNNHWAKDSGDPWADEETGAKAPENDWGTGAPTNDAAEAADPWGPTEEAQEDDAAPTVHADADDEATWDSATWDSSDRLPESEGPIRNHKPCMFFGQGYCAKGDNCALLHISPETGKDERLVKLQAQKEEEEALEEAEQQQDEGVEEEDKVQIIVEDIPESDDGPPVSRQFFNCGVRFGNDLVPDLVRTSFDSRSVTLSKLPSRDDLDTYVTQLCSKFGTIQQMSFDITMELSAEVDFETEEQAANAVRGLHRQPSEDDGKHDARLSNVSVDFNVDYLSGRTVKIGWPIASVGAWIYYSTITEAKKAEKAYDGAMIEGRKVEAAMETRAKRGQPSVAVQLKSLPFNITESRLREITSVKTVSLIPPVPYREVDTVITAVRDRLAEWGVSGPLDVVDIDKTSKRSLVFAQFEDDVGAAAAVAKLKNVKQSFLSNTPLSISQTFSTRYKVPAPVLKVVRNALDALAEEHKGPEARVVTYSSNVDHYYVRVYGQDPSLLAHLQLKVEKLIHGVVFVQDDGNVWDDYFDTSAGVNALDRLNNKVHKEEPFLVACDFRNRFVRLYGSDSARDKAATTVSTLLRKVHKAQRVIKLSEEDLQALLSGTLDEIYEDHLDRYKVVLDFTARMLTIRADTEKADKVEELLRNAVVSLPSTDEAEEVSEGPNATQMKGDDAEDIEPDETVEDGFKAEDFVEDGVQNEETAEDGAEAESNNNLGETETKPAEDTTHDANTITKCILCRRIQDHQFRLRECGHIFCRACLHCFLLSGLQPQATQLHCPALGCAAALPFSIARKLLSPEEQNDFLENAFLRFVKAQPDKLLFCPTSLPCQMVYRPDKEGTVVLCPECETWICCYCHVDAHEGVSCRRRMEILLREEQS